jgi:PhnB protein
MSERSERSAIPFLSCRDAAAAIEFYMKGFAATEPGPRWTDPEGKVGHAELVIEGARVMVADEFPEIGVVSPQSLGGSGVSIGLTVDDVDAFAERAVAAGATLVRPPADQDYGERTATITDPYGHRWLVSTPTKEMTEAELRRSAEAYGTGTPTN